MSRWRSSATPSPAPVPGIFRAGRRRCCAATAISAAANRPGAKIQTNLRFRLRRRDDTGQQRASRQLADLLSHVLSDIGGKAVVEAGIDAGVRNLVTIVLQARPFAGDTGRGR